MVKCEKIIGRKYFKSYSEFYLALCIAAELGRRGNVLDMSNMKIDKDILSKYELEYFRYLQFVGHIYIGDVNKPTIFTDNPEDLRYYMDMNDITSMVGRMYGEDETEYFWYPEFITGDDVPLSFKKISNTGNLLMHITAYVLMSEYFGEIKKKPFVVSFNNMKAKNTYFYVNLCSCSQTLDWFDDFMQLKIDFGDINVDIQYSIFCNNSQVAGHYRAYSRDEKHRLMKEMGVVEGSIVVLFERSGMCPSNIMGKITHAIIARVDEIGDDFLGITTIALNKTKEEQLLDYYSIEESKRYLFTDMLNYSPAQLIKTVSLYETGIGDHFLDEYMFITLLDPKEEVVKRVTINEEEVEISMSGIDAIYWLLCEYSIEFDRDLFRKMYSHGKLLMWDEYGNDSSVDLETKNI